jgi:hypothetical protein
MYGTITSPIEGTAESGSVFTAVPKISADNFGIMFIPLVITDGAECIVEANLNCAFLRN